MKKFGKKLVLSLTVFALTAMALSSKAAAYATEDACRNSCPQTKQCTKNTANNQWDCVASGSSGGSSGLSLSNLSPQGVTVAQDASTLIPNVVTIIFIVAAALTFAYLIYGAIKWITSGGEKSKVEEARNKITSAIIGLLILAATWAIFQLILTIAFGETGLTVPTLSGS